MPTIEGFAMSLGIVNEKMRLLAVSGAADTVAKELEPYGNESIVAIVLRGPFAETTSLADAIQRFGPLEPLFIKESKNIQAGLTPAADNCPPAERIRTKKSGKEEAGRHPSLSDWQWD
jgi:hypothetical protein